MLVVGAPFMVPRWIFKEGYMNQNFMDTLVMQVIKGKPATIWPQKYTSAKYVYPLPKWRDRK